MPETPDHKKMPAKVARTGARQLSVTLDDGQSRDLERLRLVRGMRSWGQVIRFLIAEDSARWQRKAKS